MLSILLGPYNFNCMTELDLTGRPFQRPGNYFIFDRK